MEGMLRLGGLLYQSRPAAGTRISREGDNFYRILCLGESTTAGLAWGNSAYPQQLERVLNERAAGRASFRVINGGEVATTTDVILAKLPSRLEESEPDIVVAMMGINDGAMVDPAFQVGGSLRVWKLAKMLYYSIRPKPAQVEAEELFLRAKAVHRYWPDVAVELATRAVKLLPDDPQGYVILAEARARQDEMSLAADAFAEAAKVDSSAMVAYAFEVSAAAQRMLDRALAGFPSDANAVTARAILALRREDTIGARFLATRALQIEPNNVAALVVEGSALHASGMQTEARDRFDRAVAVNPRLFDLLATRRLLAVHVPKEIVDRHVSEDGTRGSAPGEGSEIWLQRSKEEVIQRYEGLSLLRGWKRIAAGEVGAAAEGLQDIVDSESDVQASTRLRAYGQLAILEWQAGNAARAEEYHEQVEEQVERSVNPATRENYRELWRILQARDIPLVAVQYPMRRLDPLRRLLAQTSGVVFVDNERPFKQALLGRPYTEIFDDLFAGDFGHMTDVGYRILAENVAEAVLTLVPELAEE